MLAAVVARAQNFNEPESTSTDVSAMTTRNICKNVCFERVTGGLFTCNQLCPFDDDVRLVTGLDYLTRNVRVKLLPPMMKDITLDPAKPGPGSKVTARIVPVSTELEEMTLISTKVVYAFDEPANWQSVVPSLDPANRYWEAGIDVPAGAKKMFVAVRAGDQFEDTYISIPCNVVGDPWKTDICYFPLLKDENYEDIKRKDISPAQDIVKVTFGMDDRKYYFRLTVRDKIDPGRLSPPQSNYYLIAAYAPGKAPEADPFDKSAFIFYAPYLEKSADCKVLMRIGSKWTMDTSSVKCTLKDDNTIQYEIARKVIRTTPAGEFVVYAATGMVYDEDNGIITDYTSTAAIRTDKKPIDLTK